MPGSRWQREVCCARSLSNTEVDRKLWATLLVQSVRLIHSLPLRIADKVRSPEVPDSQKFVGRRDMESG
jgi:hypothetical protein